MANRTCRLLVVEDHADTAAATCRLLETHGHEVQLATTYAQAVRLCERHTFDLLLLDLGLPDGDGVDLLAEVRRLCPTVQAIAVSAYAMKEDVERTLAAGFVAHVSKPFAFPTLLKTISQILEGECETDPDRRARTDAEKSPIS